MIDLLAQTSGGLVGVRTLAALLAIVVAARIAANLAERIGVPWIVAQLGVGIALSGAVLGLVEVDEPLALLAQLGALLLLFRMGLRIDPGNLRHLGVRASLLGLAAALATIAATYPVAVGLGAPRRAAAFIALAFVPSSASIAARILARRQVSSPRDTIAIMGSATARTLLGAGLLAIAVQFAGNPDAGGIGRIAAAGAILLVATLVGIFVVPRILDALASREVVTGTLIVPILVMILGAAAGAEWVGIPAAAGAFAAGIASARSHHQARIARRIAPLSELFVPIFVVVAGLSTDVAVLAQPQMLWLTLGIASAASAATWIVGAATPAVDDRLTVALATAPRGDIALVFATVGLGTGLLDTAYTSLVVAIGITALVSPALLAWRLARRARGLDRPQPTIRGIERLHIEGQTLALTGIPAPDEALLVAIQAAQVLGDLRPSAELTEWLRSEPIDHPTWDSEARAHLFQLFEQGRDRSFRLLESTGVFAAIFPDVAEEQSPPLDLEGVYGEGEAPWDVLLSLQALLADPDDQATQAHIALDDRHILVFAAFARGAFKTSAASDRARRLAVATGFSWEQAEEVAVLVSERNLLPAAALGADLGRQEQVLELAAHLAYDRIATELYILAAAEHRTDPAARQRIDQLYTLLHAALLHHDVGGVDLLESRRHAVRRHAVDLAPELVAEHLEEAPRRYLLARAPEEIAQHLRMLDPPLGDDEVRLIAETTPEGARLHIVIKDRLGALAALSNELSHAGHEIQHASAAVWSSGIAVLVFHVAAPGGIDADALVPRLSEALAHADALPTAGPIEGDVMIDNHASPWYSIVEIKARDREGLLGTIAGSISAAGGEIVYATVTTGEGYALDRFFVVGRGGEKLTTRDERQIRDALANSR